MAAAAERVVCRCALEASGAACVTVPAPGDLRRPPLPARGSDTVEKVCVNCSFLYFVTTYVVCDGHTFSPAHFTRNPMKIKDSV